MSREFYNTIDRIGTNRDPVLEEFRERAKVSERSSDED
jgi:hypothetical protein